jgi:broad specificity phosphatase PhoE
MSGSERHGTVTTVHLVRHGEVANPTGVLYGRLPGYHLSERGQAMAQRLAEFFAGRDVAYVVSSPLERAVETATPIADELGLGVVTDERLIEAANVFQGLTFGVGDGSLRKPSHWRHLRNPFRPSWGEPYTEIVTRMTAAVESARDAAAGMEAVVVSHQLPIWTLRSALRGKRLWHDPRRRECSLASVTSLVYAGASGRELVTIRYEEPAVDLLPANAGATFSAGA